MGESVTMRGIVEGGDLSAPFLGLFVFPDADSISPELKPFSLQELGAKVEGNAFTLTMHEDDWFNADFGPCTALVAASRRACVVAANEQGPRQVILQQAGEPLHATDLDESFPEVVAKLKSSGWQEAIALLG